MKHDNLQKLTDWLKENEDKIKFDMRDFRQKEIEGFKIGVTTDFLSIGECGTVGCALGWAPFVPGLEVAEQDFDYSPLNTRLDFSKYAVRVLDVDDNHPGGLWNFLFGPRWTLYNNTLKGFISRAEYAIQHKLVEEDFGYSHFPHQTSMDDWKK